MASSVTHISTASSALYQSTVEGSHIYRETFEDRIKQWRMWLLGTDYEGRNICMGRSLIDWIMLIACYAAFFTVLVVMFVVFMALFYWIVDWNYPTIQGPTAILQTPGIGFRPQPNIHNTIVRFVKGDGATYVHHLDHIEAYLKYYENQNQQGENYIDCNEIRERRVTDLNKVCRFDLIELGPDCVKQQNFGFDDGQPCILLKLNRVFDWIPEEFTEKNVPDSIRDHWSQWWITVTCEGETAADRENHGDITYWPANGFHFKYFPFRNQQGYRSPLVFVRFENPHPGILLMMTCKAWAKNIAQDYNEMVGMVHFELMVD
ncbi:sodium/potassium-transporting ATPase subunit beta-like [Babylonia areolata]|uniref:sodium/potassium-transporting ATPase subunit beta-like n=1 Tax=Babylonia areolata TaxID=304850 RepID=UPI003FCF6DD8